MKDLTGAMFSRLTVLDLAGLDSSGHYIWACECACGKAVNASTSDLTSGHTKSCGCLKSELLGSLRRGMTVPQPGAVFGRVTVVEACGIDHANRLLVRLQCDCGNFSIARWGNVRSGITKSCGCGKYTGLLRAWGAANKSHPWRKSYSERVAA